MNVTAEVNDQAITLSKATFQSQPLQFESPSLCVNEPLVKLEAAGSWDRHTGMVKVGNLVLQSTAVALRAQHVAALWGAADRNLSGEISARANLESLTTLWRWSGRQPAPWRLRGQAQCTASLADQAGVMSAKWKATLQDCQLQRARSITDQQPRVTAASATEDWLTMAREPNIQFAGSAHFDPGQGVLAMEHLELRTADEQIVTAQGTVRDAFGACVADLTGQATYDLEALLQRARPFLGDSIRAIGRDTQTFSLQGPLRISRGPSDASEAALAAAYQPLVSPELAGRCGFSWTAADLLGIAVGSGKLQPQLNRGTIETGRIEFPLSKGQFRLEPRFYLNQHPPIMTIEPGRVLDAVEISENMCAGWLKFVTPLVAEATRAKGVFSLTLESTTVPLLRPSDASVRGELHLQQAVMGPGPLAVSLLKAVEAVEAMIKASSSANAPPVGPDQFGAFTELLGRAAGLPGQPPPSNSLDASTSRYQLHIPEQYVPFRVAERRVYHDQFHVVVGNVTIVTQGSVGLDQSLQLVASVPVLRQWVGDERLWRVLQNQSVEIPVTGTIRNPRIDTQRVQQSLRKLVGDLLRDASGRMLERELQRGLNELFRQ